MRKEGENNVEFGGPKLRSARRNDDFTVSFQSQDRRRLLSEARADPRLMSGTMTNSRTVTSESSTRYSSTSRVAFGGLKLNC